jgi:hypothetical protein
MAQTTTAMSSVNAAVEISINGTTWIDLSGSSTSVAPGSQPRMTGETHTLEGDLAVITSGKREPMDIAVSSLYTETEGETFEVLRPLHQNGTRVYFRYSPLGSGATGRAVYTATNDDGTPGACIISELDWPEVDATSADPIAIAYTVRAPGVIRTVTGNSTGLGSGA